LFHYISQQKHPPAKWQTADLILTVETKCEY